MKPSVTLAETTTPDGARLTLHLHDGHFHMRIDGNGLMITRQTRSEAQLAEVACENIRTAPGAKVLIGGLGFGFTLRRVMELVHPAVRIQVAELLPQIVAWNREYLRSFNGALLDDPRVEVLLDDVVAVLARAPAGAYDVVMLDIDNGPVALVDAGNARLYADQGLRVLSRALRRGGRAVFWSESRDRSFMRRLTAAGFRATEMGTKSYPKAKRNIYTLIVADRPG